MNVNNPNDFTAKKKRIDDAMHLKTPDRVPILSLAATWGYAYTGIKIDEIKKNPEKIIEGCNAYLKDFYMDAVLVSALTAPLNMIDVLKPIKPQYGISEDGYSLQHFECAEMKIEEYPQLITDPEKFIKEVILPRRYPVLNEPYPKNYEVLKNAYSEFIEYISTMVQSVETVKNQYGVNVLASGALFTPIDMLFDFFRGFKGLLTDIRRCPDNVIAACNNLVGYIEKTKLGTAKKGDYIFLPLHMATYMSVKQFEKIYWPSLKTSIEKVRATGAWPVLALENDWTNYLEPILDLPDNSFTAIIEYGDLKTIKEKYGKKMSIIGGMPCSMLRYSSAVECKDHAKKIIDELAPGGGYVFATDKVLLSPNDVNPGNFKAVIETVREYGKY